MHVGCEHYFQENLYSIPYFELCKTCTPGGSGLDYPIPLVCLTGSQRETGHNALKAGTLSTSHGPSTYLSAQHRAAAPYVFIARMFTACLLLGALAPVIWENVYFRHSILPVLHPPPYSHPFPGTSVSPPSVTTSTCLVP